MAVAGDLTVLEERELNLLTFTSETLHLEYSRWATSIVGRSIVWFARAIE